MFCSPPATLQKRSVYTFSCILLLSLSSSLVYHTPRAAQSVGVWKLESHWTPLSKSSIFFHIRRTRMYSKKQPGPYPQTHKVKLKKLWWSLSMFAYICRLLRNVAHTGWMCCLKFQQIAEQNVSMFAFSWT